MHATTTEGKYAVTVTYCQHLERINTTTLFFFCICRYVDDRHAKCHNSSSIITIKQEVNHRISFAVILFYNIKAYLEQKLHVFQDAVTHKIPGHTIKYTSVSAILEIQADIVLVLNIH